MTPNDTIVAIATPLGEAGVGVIRLSGDGALEIIKKMAPSLGAISPRMASYTAVIDPDSGGVLDDGMVLFFPGPHSFTGEDVVEFQGHSNVVVMKRILTVCCTLGARIAQAGEFSRRAFIHGKMDLAKAESVIELIHAQNEMAHAVAIQHVDGKMAAFITSFREEMKQVLEQLEGAIDFPDEVPGVDRSFMREILQTFMGEVDHVLSLQDYGEQIRSGVKCVVVGRPNVGKSTFFNACLGQDRSIVTDIAGTTRDYIEAHLQLGGMTFQFTDTAGIQETADIIEAEGIARIKALIDSAHVVLWLLDGSEPLSDEDLRVYDLISTKSLVYVVKNKRDQEERVSLDVVNLPKEWPIFSLSAKHQEGLAALKKQLHRDFIEKIKDVDLDLICSVRQEDCLRRVQSFIAAILVTLDQEVPDDLLSIDLRNVIETLGEITGDDLTESVLDGIFSRFCVGK